MHALRGPSYKWLWRIRIQTLGTSEMFGIVVVLLALFGGSFSQECETSKIDRCGALIWPFLVDPNATPADANELESACKGLREGEKCARDYFDQCPDIINKEIRDGVIDSLSTTINDFCTGNLGRRFLLHGRCMKEKLARNFTCNAEAIQLMEAAAVSEPPSDRLKLTCCSYLKLDKCYTGAVQEVCDRQAARSIRNLMQSYSIFMVEKCLPFLADPGQCDLSGLVGLKPANGRKAKTFLPALLDVAIISF